MINKEQQPNDQRQPDFYKEGVSRRSHRGVKRCAEWLDYCLEIGWDKSQIDELEALWWKHHDEHGNVVRGNGG